MNRKNKIIDVNVMERPSPVHSPNCNVFNGGRKSLHNNKVNNTLQHFKQMTRRNQVKVKPGCRTLLPNTRLYPESWTYLVSNTKHPHTITVEEFRKIKLKEGDKIYFERGQVYNWTQYTVTINNLTFGAYGTGADPIFLGSTSYTASTWTSETGGYYSTPLATAPLWVFKDGVEARHGESDWLQVVSKTNDTTIVGTTAVLQAYNAVEPLAGGGGSPAAKFRGKEFPFRYSYEETIATYNGTNTLTFGPSNTGFAANSGFKLYGQKQFATLEGDWWYDDANDKLWIKTASTPAGTNIRVCTENYAFFVNDADDITITGLEFTQYYRYALITALANNFTLSDFYVHDIRGDGVWIAGNSSGIDIQQGEIERTSLNGMVIGAISSSTVSGIEIHNIGNAGNYGWPISGTIKTGGTGIMFQNELGQTTKLASSVVIEEMSIYDLGYQGIAPLGPNHIIRDSVIHNFCLRWEDGGGVHSFYRSDLGPGESTSNGLVQNCYIYDGVGSEDGLFNYTLESAVSAVYIDNGSVGWEVDNCVLYSCPWAGVFTNAGTEDTNIHDCLIADNGAQVRFYENEDIAAAQSWPLHNYKNDLNNNTLLSPYGQTAVYTSSQGSTANSAYNPYSTGGTADNNIYINPNKTATTNVTFRHQTISTVTTYTLATWITRNGRDASSTSRGFYLDSSSPTLGYDQFLIYSNQTASSEFHDLPNGVYTDENNVDINDITVAPGGWGVALIKPSYYYIMDSFIGTAGSSISGRTPTIGSNWTVLSGTHTVDASDRMVSSVTGLVVNNAGADDYVYEMLVSCTNTSASMRADVRMTDALGSGTHRILLDFNSGNVRLREYNGSSVTPTQSISTAFAISVSPIIYRVKIVCDGASVQLYIGDTLYLSMTTVLLTGSYIGIFGETTSRREFVVLYPPQP